MEDYADLLKAVLAAVIPEQPLGAVENRIRFVTGVVIPFVLARKDDRVGGMALPVGDAILAAGEADPRRGLILEADVKHHIPVADFLDLTGGDLMLLPRILGFCAKDRVALMLLPGQSVGAGRVTDGVRLDLFTA